MRQVRHEGRNRLAAALLGGAALLCGCPSGDPAAGRRVDPPAGTVAGRPSAGAVGVGGDRRALGLRLFRDGDLQGAEPHLSQALRSAPGDPRILEALGAIHAAGDRARQAEGLLRQALELDPASRGAWMTLATVLVDTGRDAEALQAVLEVRRLAPGFQPAVLEEIRLLPRLGRCEAAVSLARAAIARGPESAETYYLLAGCLRDGGDLDAAAESLHRAVGLDADHLGALSQLAAIEMRRGLPEAAERFRQAHRDALARVKVADQVRGHRRAGIAAFNRGDLQTALVEFEAMAAVTPGDAEVHLSIGSVYLALGRYDEARAPLEESLRLGPRNERALTEMGRLLALTDRFDEASDMLQRAITANPDYPEPHYVLAGLHMARGDSGLYQREMNRFEELRSRYEAPGSGPPAVGETP